MARKWIPDKSDLSRCPEFYYAPCSVGGETLGRGGIDDTGWRILTETR